MPADYHKSSNRSKNSKTDMNRIVIRSDFIVLQTTLSWSGDSAAGGSCGMDENGNNILQDLVIKKWRNVAFIRLTFLPQLWTRSKLRAEPLPHVFRVKQMYEVMSGSTVYSGLRVPIHHVENENTFAVTR